MRIRPWSWALAAAALVVAEPPGTKAPAAEPARVAAVSDVWAEPASLPIPASPAQPASPYLPAARPRPISPSLVDARASTSCYLPAARAEPTSSSLPDARAQPASSYLPRPPAGTPATGEHLPPPQAVVPFPPVAADAPCATAPSAAARPLTRREDHRLKAQDCFLGYRSEFEALPLGYRVAEHYRTHVGNAVAARMVLYQYDFLPNSAVPNLRGQDRLAQIADLLTQVPYSVVIERTPNDPALAGARRLAVLQALDQGPFPIAPERVVIGPPIAHGLSGPEALRVYFNLLNQVEKAGGVKAGLDSFPTPGLGVGGGGGAGVGAAGSGPGQPPTIP